MKQVMWTNSAYERVLDTQEKKDKFYLSYNTNIELLDVIAKAFQDKLDTCTTATRSLDTYKDSSWAYRQADSNGYKRALTEVIRLLVIRDKEENDRSK